MKTVLKTTALLGSSAFATLLSTLVVSKVAAHQLGPEGFGYQGLLMGFVGLLTLFFGLGVGPGLVKFLAIAREAGDARGAERLQREGWRLIGWTNAALLLGVMVLHGPLNQVFFAGMAPLHDLLLGALGVVCALFNSVYVAILTTEHPPRLLARSAAIGALGAMIANVLGLLTLGRAFIGFSVFFAFFAPLLVYALYGLRRVPWSLRGKGDPVVRRQLLNFGLPYTASILVGAGVQYLVPLLILRYTDQGSVGYYRVATAVAATYLTFLLNAMAQEYYPRIARTALDQLEGVANAQMRLLLYLAGPLILASMFFSHLVITVLFSSEFIAAEKILELQAMADLFKFGCWSFSFVVLSHLSSRSYFLLELLWGSVLLCTLWLSLHTGHLVALGYGHLIAYAIYAQAVIWTVRRTLKLKLERGNALLLLALGLSATLVFFRDLDPVLYVIAIAVILLWLALGARYLHQTLRERSAPLELSHD